MCSIVGALAPTHVRVTEALNFDNLEKLSQKEIDKIALVFADVSDIEGDAGEFWTRLKCFSFVKPENMFAICAEGNTQQYVTALKNGAADLFTVPLEDASFRRRTLRLLEKAGIVETAGDLH